jgi:molecular chaperone DnaK (HSP70)
VPSRIQYDIEGNVTSWGFDLDPDNSLQLQWFKLLLSDEAQNEDGDKVKEARRRLGFLNKTPVDVVADYLRCLWAHTLTVLETKLTQVALKNMLFKVVITLPAAWDHSAENRTREAAIKAGLQAPRACGPTTLELIVEPEAAALAAFDDSGLQWRPDLKVWISRATKRGGDLTSK